MMAKKQELLERLSRDFEVCDRHILRIKEALQGLSAEQPLSLDAYSALTPEQVRCIDQFIFRFSNYWLPHNYYQILRNQLQSLYFHVIIGLVKLLQTLE